MAHIGDLELATDCPDPALRPDLKLSPVRGNLGTRLAKLDSGEFDGLVLASAGLKRLGVTVELLLRQNLRDTCLPVGRAFLESRSVKMIE